MSINQANKPRCANCKSILVKGILIEGLARIKCDNCGSVNVLVKPAEKKVA